MEKRIVSIEWFGLEKITWKNQFSLWPWHQDLDQVGVLREMRSIHAIWIAPSLPTSPIWNATETVVASLPPMPDATNISSVPGCHLPVLDPWNPGIPQFFSSTPRLVSSFALFDVLTLLLFELVLSHTDKWQSNQPDVLCGAEVPRLHWHRLTHCQWNCPPRAWSPWKSGPKSSVIQVNLAHFRVHFQAFLCCWPKETFVRLDQLTLI